MLYYSPMLTVVVLVAAVCYGLLRWAMYGPQRRATDERIVHEAKAATHFIETLRGMMAIKLNLRESERRSAYLNHVVDQTNADVRVQNLALLQRAGNVLVFGIENVLVIWLGAYAVLDNQLSVGMLFAFLLFKLLFITRVNNLVDKTIEFRMLDLHADRVADIALAEPEGGPSELPAVARADAPSAPFVLQGRDIGFAYGIEGFVFRGVDFAAKPGEMVAIVGPSGAGKTTLVKVLAGLLDRTEGSLTAAGRDVRDWDKAAYRSRIGVVMQDDHLFVGTIEDNISFFDPQHDAAAGAGLRPAGDGRSGNRRHADAVQHDRRQPGHGAIGRPAQPSPTGARALPATADPFPGRDVRSARPGEGTSDYRWAAEDRDRTGNRQPPPGDGWGGGSDCEARRGCGRFERNSQPRQK